MGSHIDPERQVHGHRTAARHEFSVRIIRNWTMVEMETQCSSGMQALRGIQEAWNGLSSYKKRKKA